jgi:hypothetical protein
LLFICNGLADLVTKSSTDASVAAHRANAVGLIGLVVARLHTVSGLTRLFSEIQVQAFNFFKKKLWGGLQCQLTVQKFLTRKIFK